MRSLFRPRVILTILLVAMVGIHVWNYLRVNAGGLAAGIEPLIERTREIERRARPEYQDHVLATLPPNADNGPFHRLDDLLAEAETREAPDLEARGEEAILYRLEMDDPAGSGLEAPDGAVAQSLSNGILRLSDHGGTGHVTNVEPITVRQEEIGDIIIRARASKQTRLTLAWSADADPENPFRNRVDMTLAASDELQTYVINARNVLKRGLAPNDPVAHIYLRPSSVADAEIEIDFIRFVSKQALYLSAINGVVHEALGGELRRAIHMLPDQTLSWQLDVPEEAPRLDLGQGLLTSGDPVRFSVAVEEGDSASTVHEAEIATAESWHDVSIDLAPWAGRSVRLSLRVENTSADTSSRAVALWSSPRLHSKPRKRFNIVFILEDALRADYLSTYGYERETSPNKTALVAERGVIFEHAFSQATKTRPSMPSLMTGLYPTATGVWHFSDLLSERYLTLAEILRSQGFTTASFIQNGNAGPYAGLHQGFDVLRDEKMMGEATENVLGEPAFEWLEQHRDQNFFLYLHAIDPHGPYDPMPPFDEWYIAEKGRGSAVTPDFRYEPDGMTEATDDGRRARYAGEIRHNDELIPALLEKLETLGLAQNTLVVFLSDHGEYMGEHGDWEHRPPGFTPTIRVPLMMLYPEGIAEAKRITENVQLADVVPTVLELAGIDHGDLLLQGESLVSLIEGREPEYWRERLVVSEEPTAMIKNDPCPCGSLFYRNWHLVASTWTWPGGPLVSWFPTPQAVLKMRAFDFHEDPREESLFWSFLPDLYLRWLHYDAVTRLREIGGSIHERITADDDASKRLDPETLEHLRGLGYVN